MGCKFCYATFEDLSNVTQLPKAHAFDILSKLKLAGLEKITFAGGEPLLYKHIIDVIEYSKHLGLVTSIITNGSLITDSFLDKVSDTLDWIGISVDSLNANTNKLIGRIAHHPVNYLDLCLKIKDLGFKLKINTVVNQFNWYADLNDFINDVQPQRWKVFQALRVQGQNDKQFEEIKVTGDQFRAFIKAHSGQKCMVVEDNKAMTGSYLLIDPQGRLFENSKGMHTYSTPLQNSDVESCINELTFDREAFIKRGGIYAW